jgi:hypothetical protein
MSVCPCDCEWWFGRCIETGPREEARAGEQRRQDSSGRSRFRQHAPLTSKLNPLSLIDQSHPLVRTLRANFWSVPVILNRNGMYARAIEGTLDLESCSKSCYKSSHSTACSSYLGALGDAAKLRVPAATLTLIDSFVHSRHLPCGRQDIVQTLGFATA